MPSVSKKLVTHPIVRCIADGAPSSGSGETRTARTQLTMSSRPLATSAPSSIATSVTARDGIVPAGFSQGAVMTDGDDRFELYDLRVDVVATDRPMVCSHRPGDWFEVRGENISFPAGQTFSMYALAALLPLLPAKQRKTHAHD